MSMINTKSWLRILWGRFDNLIFFHPSRWPHAEFISRLVAIVIICGFLVQRIINFHDFPQTFQTARHFYRAFVTTAGQPVYSNAAIALIWGIKLTVWLFETVIFIVYIAAYISRAKTVGIARGFMETAFPVIVAGLPFLIALAPYNLVAWMPYAASAHLAFFTGIMGCIVLGSLLNLMGLICLRRAFTIMSEARVLITSGPFKYMRHPLYTGHFIIFSGSLFLRLHSYTILLYFLFFLGQIHRARIEERKLIQSFPEYEFYQKNTGMFLPRKWFR
jgi:protein-S-isoprenylcysteine O-methyltransferase Ste14